MRSIIVLLRTILYLIGAAKDGRVAKKLLAKGDMTTFHHLVDSRVRHWALAMLRFAGVTVEVHGDENITNETALYIPNHQSDWDIMVMLAYGPACGLLSKDSIGKIPLIRTWMEYIDCVFIDRSDARKSLKSLRQVDKNLKAGRNMVVFPEGTRSKSEEILKFHDGSFRNAAKSGIPIVPVSIDGTYKIMEANSGKWIKPGHVILTFLPPIQTKDLEKEQLKTLGDDIKAQILEAREASRHANDMAPDASAAEAEAE